MPHFRSLPMSMAWLVGTALRAAAPPVSATPAAIRLGSDRLRIGGGQVVVAPNARVLASSEVGDVCLWELPSGRLMRRFEYANYLGGGAVLLERMVPYIPTP